MEQTVLEKEFDNQVDNPSNELDQRLKEKSTNIWLILYHIKNFPYQIS